MRQNDLLESDTGDHLRVLLYGDQQSYVVNCQRCKMPFPISTPSLLQMEKLPQDMYRLLSLDEDISEGLARDCLWQFHFSQNRPAISMVILGLPK